METMSHYCFPHCFTVVNVPFITENDAFLNKRMVLLSDVASILLLNQCVTDISMIFKAITPPRGPI